MKVEVKKQKGITLVALIITIIVLLILAVVAIRAVTGDGIIAHAKNTRDEYSQAQREEERKLMQLEYTLAKEQGSFKGTYQDYLDKKEYEKAKKEGTYSGTYEEYVKNKYALGEAINTGNYGKRVVGFQSKGKGLETLVWRVFYEDTKNVYLISSVEKEDGSKEYPIDNHLSFYNYDDSTNTYTKKAIVEKYNSGANVSLQGQILMQIGNNLFTESNVNRSIIASAYLCDIEVWDDYTDEAGNAAWAIGSPTIELFAKSYNACDLEHTIDLEVNSVGYSSNTNNDWFTTEQKNGIYRLKHGGGYWWMVAPSSGYGNMYCVNDYSGCFSSYSVSWDYIGVRPVVCIPRSNFNYTLTD